MGSTSPAACDGLSQLTGITHAPAASPSIAYGYAHDAASRITALTTPEGTSNFTLAATDQLPLMFDRYGNASASRQGRSPGYGYPGDRHWCRPWGSFRASPAFALAVVPQPSHTCHKCMKTSG